MGLVGKKAGAGTGKWGADLGKMGAVAEKLGATVGKMGATVGKMGAVAGKWGATLRNWGQRRENGAAAISRWGRGKKILRSGRGTSARWLAKILPTDSRDHMKRDRRFQKIPAGVKRNFFISRSRG